MKKNSLLVSLLFILVFNPGCKKSQVVATRDTGNTIHDEAPVKQISMHGEAPSLYSEEGNTYLVYASGDSIYYSFSDDLGRSFTSPMLVAVLKDLVNAGGRGPQIAGSKEQLMIAAPDKSGNLFTWLKNKSDKTWIRGARINDLNNTAPEGFISLDAGNDGNFFAIWLDLRLGHGNSLFGAASKDGGKTWQKNILIYRSPDGAICDCCKPSIDVKNKQIAIMFRNNLKGNRDLYLIQSRDGGETFGIAEKLGKNSWKINGCPMDGGGLVINKDDSVQTVWRREGDIYINQPGKNEVLVCQGMKCIIAETNGNNYIAFASKGKIYCRKPDGNIIELGAGYSYPKLVAIDNKSILCAWENDKMIYRVLVN